MKGEVALTESAPQTASEDSQAGPRPWKKDFATHVIRVPHWCCKAAARGRPTGGHLKGAQRNPGPVENPFPIITGTSACGAINAAVLSVNADNFAKAVDTLVHVWTNFHPSHVYHRCGRCAERTATVALLFPVWRIHQDQRVSLFDNSPLAGLIANTCRLRVYSRSSRKRLSARAVAVTAAGYTSGQNCAFFQAAPDVQGWKRSAFISLRGIRVVTAHRAFDGVCRR